MRKSASRKTANKLMNLGERMTVGTRVNGTLPSVAQSNKIQEIVESHDSPRSRGTRDIHFFHNRIFCALLCFSEYNFRSEKLCYIDVITIKIKTKKQLLVRYQLPPFIIYHTAVSAGGLLVYPKPRINEAANENEELHPSSVNIFAR